MIDGWLFFLTVMGLIMMIIGTTRDEWALGGASSGDFITAGSLAHPYLRVSTATARREFGTNGYRESAIAGYGYTAPNVCGSHGQLHEVNEVSEGMIAMLLLANIAGFIAAAAAVLAATNSSLVVTLKPARTWAIVAAVFSLITWALWLRAHEDNINAGNKHDGSCFFRANLTGTIENDKSRSVGGSFGMAVVSTAFYVILAFFATRLIKSHGENSPAHQRWFTLMFALIAFVLFFVASVMNQWSVQFNSGAEKYLQRLIDNQNSQPDSLANVLVTIESYYGVYTAQLSETYTWVYNNHANRAYVCPYNGGTESDGSAVALVQSGRVVLGVCLTAIVFGLVSVVTIHNHPAIAFYTNLGALSMAGVALLVWSLVSFYIVQIHCCNGPECSVGSSYGIIAAGAVFYAIALYYQAWVMYNDVYVLDSKWQS